MSDDDHRARGIRSLGDLDRARLESGLSHEAIFRLTMPEVLERFGLVIATVDLRAYERAVERQCGYYELWQQHYRETAAGEIQQCFPGYYRLFPIERFVVTCRRVDWRCPEPLIRQDARAAIPSRYSIRWAEANRIPESIFRVVYAKFVITIEPSPPTRERMH
jgi:hypothetical protein